MTFPNLFFHNVVSRPIPVAMRFKAQGCDLSLARIPLGHACLLLVSVVCFQLEVCTSGWSLVQRSRNGCGVSNNCDREDT
jgi:hypothetical protein